MIYLIPPNPMNDNQLVLCARLISWYCVNINSSYWSINAWSLIVEIANKLELAWGSHILINEKNRIRLTFWLFFLTQRKSYLICQDSAILSRKRFGICRAIYKKIGNLQFYHRFWKKLAVQAAIANILSNIWKIGMWHLDLNRSFDSQKNPRKIFDI